MDTSKTILKKWLPLGAALLVILGWSASGALAVQGTPLPGNKIAKVAQFVEPLPLLSVAGGTMETVIAGAEEIKLNMLEFQANMLPSTFVPANGLPYTGTWVFGYRLGPTTAPETAVDTNVGPVIVATRGTPTQIRYINNLTDNHIFWREWTDQSLHSAFHQIYGYPMPMSGDAAHYPGPIPAVPHLHGGEDPAVIDGGPEAYFLSNQGDFTDVVNTHGPNYYAGTDVAGTLADTLNPAAFNEAIYRYPNTQEAAPLWFHDHLLGGTRLNATYSGLAGAYDLIDLSLVLPTGLHPVGVWNADQSNLRYVVPLAIQDRMFDTNGQLYFPNVGINPEHPYWIPEFVGDVIIVNGKVWPYMNVDRQRYRFFLIDGSNSRPYDMFLQDVTSMVKGPRMWVISTGGGYMDSPVLIDPNATGQQTKAGVQKSLLMFPGERYEIIVDFNDPAWIAAETAAYDGAVPNPLNLVLRNTAPTVDGNPKASTDGRIMQFRVSATAPADTSYNPASGTPIRTGGQQIVRLVDPVAGTLAAGVTADKTRELTLVEISGPGGPLEVLVNNTKWIGLSTDTVTFTDGVRPDSTFVPAVNQPAYSGWGNYLTELPTEGDTEVWEIVNMTADAHPIHLHGLQFQLMNRQAFDAKAYAKTYAAAFPGGAFIPGYGPPLPYGPDDEGYDATLQGGKYGGNPDPVLLGAALPPLSYEAGWKDTVIMPSGQVSRIAVRIAPQDKAIEADDLYWDYQPNALNGTYVWHCHITDHEDNEMMRPSQFLPNPVASRTYEQGIDY